MKPAVVTDFDGTITVGEVSAALLERFGEGDWHTPVDLLLKGEIGIAECMRRQFATIHVPKDELVRYVKETTVIRPGFDRFVRFCLGSGIPLTICSAGMDVYIEAALGHYPWYGKVPIVVGKARFGGDGIDVAFPMAKQGLVDFKATLVEEKKSQGFAVVYIGDGVSDEGAGVRADFVFARDRLLALCRARGIRHQAFDDFYQVQHGLELLLNAAPTGRHPHTSPRC